MAMRSAARSAKETRVCRGDTRYARKRPSATIRRIDRGDRRSRAAVSAIVSRSVGMHFTVTTESQGAVAGRRKVMPVCPIPSLNVGSVLR